MDKGSYGWVRRTEVCRKAAAESHLDNAAYMRRMKQAMEEYEIEAESASHKPVQHARAFDPSALAEVPSGVEVTSMGEKEARVFTETQPVEANGSLIQLTEAPLLCGSIRGDARRCIVGGADHDLYEVNLGSRFSGLSTAACGIRRLSGHAEWITAVEYFPDDRCASTGMDGRLCVWNPGKSMRPQSIQAHQGSISSLICCSDSNTLISAGYDANIAISTAQGKQPKLIGELIGQKAPILTVRFLGNKDGFMSKIVSGGRDGSLAFWDLKAVRLMRKVLAHEGHLTALCPLDETKFVSGGQDGRLVLWDTRRRHCIFTVDVHSNSRGRGAVGNIEHTCVDGSSLIVSSGADSTIAVSDVRKGLLEPVHRFTDHRDFIYSLTVRYSVAVSGSGDGSLHIHDLRSFSTAYGLGAQKAAVRMSFLARNTLIAAGDDGSMIKYDYQN